MITVIKYDENQGYLVLVNVARQKIWLPATVISGCSRKPWNFGFVALQPPTPQILIKTYRKKKPSFRLEGNGTPTIQESELIPEFRDRLRDLTVQAGSKVILKCRVRQCGPNCRQTWKKLDPSMCVLRNGRFMLDSNDEGVAVLSLENAKPSDSGTYSFTVTNDFGSASCSCILTVLSNSSPLGMFNNVWF